MKHLTIRFGLLNIKESITPFSAQISHADTKKTVRKYEGNELILYDGILISDNQSVF